MTPAPDWDLTLRDKIGEAWWLLCADVCEWIGWRSAWMVCIVWANDNIYRHYPHAAAGSAE